jgi:hypothetical protein
MLKPKIKYSKDLKWLEPFVNHVNMYIPLEKIKTIKSYKVKEGLEEQAYGSTVKRGNKYSINILNYRWSRVDNQYHPETIAVLLDVLAHELAHVQQDKKDFGKHDYKHFKIQAWILASFADILKQLDIVDTSARFNNLVE